MIVLYVLVGLSVVVFRCTLKRNQVVSYLDGRVIDLENEKWGISSGGSSDEAIRLTVLFQDLSSVVIPAKRHKIYSLGEHLVIKKVVLFKRFVYYREVNK